MGPPAAGAHGARALLAARHAKLPLVRLLLANGALMDTKDKKGRTALSLAEKLKRESVRQRLLNPQNAISVRRSD